MNIGKQIKEGLLTQNPVLVQLLGMCSTLAITTTISNGIGMGLSVTIILTLSNIFISVLRKIIPDQVRIACYIVVNCIILARAESFASKNKPAAAAVDGICQGIGYTLVLLIISAIREFLGSGALAGNQLFPAEYSASLIAQPVGGFLTLGCLIALMQWAQRKVKGGK